MGKNAFGGQGDGCHGRIVGDYEGTHYDAAQKSLIYLFGDEAEKKNNERGDNGLPALHTVLIQMVF